MTTSQTALPQTLFLPMMATTLSVLTQAIIQLLYTLLIKSRGKIITLNSLPVSGDYPKYVCMFPDNKHLMSMNNEGNSITIFTVDYNKGLIVMNGKELKISRPNNMVIKKLS